MIELNLLLIFMIIGAIVAVEIRSLLSSVVAVGVVGFALCVVFFFLRAPDVAITQLVVEIIVLVILIRATGIKRDVTEMKGEKRELISQAISILCVIGLGIFSFWAVRSLPEFGKPLMSVSRDYFSPLVKSGAVNRVASVLLDFRAYDTLGEATVLFTAVVGAIAILRKRGRKKIEEEDKEG
ncbi:MAG: hydrogen gas-evolving membrane-bound hydrogenase subunit E [Candidatus Margulisiibacteriota bacterium]